MHNIMNSNNTTTIIVITNNNSSRSSISDWNISNGNNNINCNRLFCQMAHSPKNAVF